MEMFTRILKTAVEGGASDVHLKIGSPVIFRINRQLIAIECPLPTEEWMNKIVAQVTPAHWRGRIDEEREAAEEPDLLAQAAFTLGLGERTDEVGDVEGGRTHRSAADHPHRGGAGRGDLVQPVVPPHHEEEHLAPSHQHVRRRGAEVDDGRLRWNDDRLRALGLVTLRPLAVFEA